MLKLINFSSRENKRTEIQRKGENKRAEIQRKVEKECKTTVIKGK